MSESDVIVTGATGYIGPRLVQALRSNGNTVHVLARDPKRVEQNSAHHVIAIPDTTSALVDIVGKVKPRVCFHLATHFLPTHKPDDIPALIRANVEFSTMMGEACARTGNVRFVNAGTLWQHVEAKEYGPASLYAASKQAFLDMLRYYADVESLEVIHLDVSDTYGPNDPRPKLLQHLVRAASTGEALAMSEGNQLLDPVYVDDAVRAFVVAGDIDRQSEPLSRYSISSGNLISLRDYVATLERATGKRVPIHWGARPYRPREMFTPWTWAPPLPGWEPQISLEEGFRAVFAAPETKEQP